MLLNSYTVVHTIRQEVVYFLVVTSIFSNVAGYVMDLNERDDAIPWEFYGSKCTDCKYDPQYSIKRQQLAVSMLCWFTISIKST